MLLRSCGFESDGDLRFFRSQERASEVAEGRNLSDGDAPYKWEVFALELEQVLGAAS